VPTSQVQSSADQLLVAQAISVALPPDVRLGSLAAAPWHADPLAADSALDRCVLLSRLIL